MDWKLEVAVDSEVGEAWAIGRMVGMSCSATKRKQHDGQDRLEQAGVYSLLGKSPGRTASHM